MNHSGDAAEQIIRISLDGMEHVLRIAGSGAKNIAALIMAAMKSDGTDDKLKLKGKERLTNMLKSGKELKIFSMNNSDLEQFSKEAKRYGVVYCALKEKNAKPDSVVDVMAKAEDASKISRIMERLQFAAVDRASIESKMAKTVDSGQVTVDSYGDVDKLIDQLIDKDGKAVKDEKLSTVNSGLSTEVNPTRAEAEKQTRAEVSAALPSSSPLAASRPSESRYRTQSESAGDTLGIRAPESVKEFLRERTAQNRRIDESKQPDRKQPEPKKQPGQKPPQHQQPQRRGRNKSKKSKER